jgi:ribose transport system permease protein
MSRRVMSKGPHSYVRPVEVVVPYALVAIALVAAGIAVPGFLSSSHLSALSITAAYLGIIAIGQTMVLLLGGIDLSVPYMINLAAILMAGLQFSHVAAGADFLIVIGFGVGAGLVNGLGVALLDISPLVMTLGMNSILEGVALIYSNGSPQGIAPTFVTNLSTGGTTIPYVVIVWAALLVIVTLALVFTRFGRSVYAVGSNRRASDLSGLPVKRTIVTAYVISGLAAAFGGILLVGYTGSAYLGMGDSYLLPSIAVVVIGGTSILGGRGSYVQTVAGALLITVIESALITVGVDQPGQDVLYGGVILLMAYVNQVAVSGAGRRLTFSGSALGPLRGWIEPVRRPGDGAGVPDDPGG